MHKIWNMLVLAMTSWHEGKVFIEHSVSFSHDALHILVGVLLWIALGLLLRRRLTSWPPWLWLFAAIVWNETVDLWIEQWPDHGHQYGESAKDLLLTMAVPTILMAAARARPDLFRGGRTRKRR